LESVAKHFPTFANFGTWLSAVNYRRIACRCLVFLAVVSGVGATGSGAFWNHQRCTQTADSMERMGGCMAARIYINPDEMTPGDREWVRWYALMKSKYRAAAWQPWLLLVPDPDEPRP
jgi:hypothetical protein